MISARHESCDKARVIILCQGRKQKHNIIIGYYEGFADLAELHDEQCSEGMHKKDGRGFNKRGGG